MKKIAIVVLTILLLVNTFLLKNYLQLRSDYVWVLKAGLPNLVQLMVNLENGMDQMIENGIPVEPRTIYGYKIKSLAIDIRSETVGLRSFFGSDFDAIEYKMGNPDVDQEQLLGAIRTYRESLEEMAVYLFGKEWDDLKYYGSNKQFYWMNSSKIKFAIQQHQERTKIIHEPLLK